MSEHTTKHSSVDDEIDLAVVFRGIKNFFKQILKLIFNAFRFFYNHKYVLLALIILGGVLGYIYEQNAKKIYTNDLLVISNYRSSDYLYTKIESLDAKLNQDDSLFLKGIFGKHYKLVKSIEIIPVIDIYDFLSQNESNQELFQLLFEEEGSIDFVENPINSRNFKYHHIYLDVKGEEHHQDLSNTLASFINNNDYFKELKELNTKNISFQLEENKRIIQQIDSIVSYAKQDKSLNLGSTGLSFSDNLGLNEMLGKKKSLIDQQKELQRLLFTQNETIKIVDSNYKVFNNEDFLKKDKKKLFPLLLISLYIFFFLLKYVLKKAKSYSIEQ